MGKINILEWASWNPLKVCSKNYKIFTRLLLNGTRKPKNCKASAKIKIVIKTLQH